MARLLRTRLLRIAFVALLVASMAVTPSLAAPLPQPASLQASARQDNGSAGVPGLGELPSEATVVSATSGQLEEPVEAPVTLTVERLSVEPGASLDPVDGPQIIQVEQGVLTFEDDLGLEAEITDGGAQFFAAGEGDVITNSGDEVVILLRTTLGDGASSDTEDNSDQSDGEGETRDRNDNGAEQGSQSAGVRTRPATMQETPTPTPDEVVITLTEDGFDPDQFEIAQGGDLVIENATEDACTFEIPDLRIETEIDAGDIESVTVEGSAGTHEFTCSNADGDVIADGSFFLARTQLTPKPTETAEAPATPETENESATPAATPEMEETAATPTGTAPDTGEAVMGVLIEVTLESVPEDPQELFAAQIVLDPDGSLSLAGAGGPIGLAVNGGDLTVTRPGHSPARLRDGRAVLLPGGTVATLSNTGNDPITLQLAGLVSAAGGDTTDTSADETSTPEDSTADTGPIDVTGANQFIPSDAEMEQLGLFGQRGGAVENDDPAQNTLWFTDSNQAEELLPTFDWQGSVLIGYDSNSDETAYGEVDVFIINVDIFPGDSEATDFFGYVESEVFMGQADSSSTVRDLEGVDQQLYVTFYDSDTETDYGIMLIQSGEYVISLYTTGPDLDAAALMEDVASLIFGPRG